MSNLNLQEAQAAIASAVDNSPHFARLMHVFCDEIGPHPAGSANIRRAQEFLLQEWSGFGASGLQAEDVDLRAWHEGEAGVEMTAPRTERFDCIQAINSAAGSVTGKLVDAGKLQFEDAFHAGDAVRDAIVLMQGHVFSGGQFEPIQKRISLAEAMGASAVVLIGPEWELPIIQYLNRARIPVLGISGKSGEHLRRLMQHAEVKITTTAGGKNAPTTCRNIWGELKPTRETNEVIIACAHHDCFYLSPAAMDNTSGVITMTEIARALAPYQNNFIRKLRFISFTGEELGYAGSKSYVSQHAAELDSHRFMFSMDCMFESTAEGVAVMWSPSMRDYIASSFAETYPDIDVRNFFCMSSDYLPFMLAGIPAARPADWKNSFPQWTHTTEDTADKVPIDWLKRNAIVYAQLLIVFLTDPAPLPVKRLSNDEIKELVLRDGAAEALRWQVLLPA